MTKLDMVERERRRGALRLRTLRLTVPRLVAFMLAWLMIGAGFAVAAEPSPAPHPGTHKAQMTGFLPKGDVPDSLALLAPPPKQGSAAFAADEEAYRVTRALRGTARWTQAAKDANLDFPEAAEAFSCALGVPITEKETPHLYHLMVLTRADAGRATGKAKVYYQRTRPFVVKKEATCSPSDERYLRKNGSYPSGHSSIGWAWALILAEIAPDRTDAILARGEAFGESRVVCGFHWLSDVIAGRIVGAGVVARLHADPAFRMYVEAARADLAGARARNLKPTRDCKAEAAALASDKPPAP